MKDVCPNGRSVDGQRPELSDGWRLSGVSLELGRPCSPGF